MRRLALTQVLVAAVLIAPEHARADVTSWLTIGTGAAAQRGAGSSRLQGEPALTYSVGVGTSPLSPAVLGLLFRGTTMFGTGTDASAAVRGATGGFARGNWGLALDLGAAWQGWRSSGGQWPLQAVLTAGAPWGLELALGAQVWNPQGRAWAQGGFAALELDLLRLTVDRRGPTELWWPNPLPAGGSNR